MKLNSSGKGLRCQGGICPQGHTWSYKLQAVFLIVSVTNTQMSHLLLLINDNFDVNFLVLVICHQSYVINLIGFNFDFKEHDT